MQADVILKEPLPWVPPLTVSRGGTRRGGGGGPPPRTPLQWHCISSIQVTRILTLEQWEFIFKNNIPHFLTGFFLKTGNHQCRFLFLPNTF